MKVFKPKSIIKLLALSLVGLSVACGGDPNGNPRKNLNTPNGPNANDPNNPNATPGEFPQPQNSSTLLCDEYDRFAFVYDGTSTQGIGDLYEYTLYAGGLYTDEVANSVRLNCTGSQQSYVITCTGDGTRVELRPPQYSPWPTAKVIQYQGAPVSYGDSEMVCKNIYY